MEYNASVTKHLFRFMETKETATLLLSEDIESVRQRVIDENLYNQKAHSRLKISFTVPITAGIKSKNPGDRLIQEKFTLKSGRYKRSGEYFLVLLDREDESLEISRYKFEIDISGDEFRV